jgi:hypothetical protein
MLKDNLDVKTEITNLKQHVMDSKLNMNKVEKDPPPKVSKIIN